jgi:hypothetical protein
VFFILIMLSSEEDIGKQAFADFQQAQKEAKEAAKAYTDACIASLPDHHLIALRDAADRAERARADALAALQTLRPAPAPAGMFATVFHMIRFNFHGNAN